MPRHPPDTLSSLTTFIDHRHDPSGEELALQGITGGRAGNGTNDQQWVTFVVTRPASRSAARPTRQKGARRLPPDRKTKIGWEVANFVHPRITEQACPEPWDEPFEPHHSLVKEQTDSLPDRAPAVTGEPLGSSVPSNTGESAGLYAADWSRFDSFTKDSGGRPSRTAFVSVPHASSPARCQWPSC